MSGRAGGGSSESVSSTYSTASQYIRQMLPENFDIDETVEIPLKSQDQQTIDLGVIISNGLDLAVIDDSNVLVTEIVALIKEYGGWAGAALAVSVTSYVSVTENTIQGLIMELPGMLLTVLSNSALPGYVVNTATRTVKVTMSILFLRAFISYLSIDPTNIRGDLDSVKTKMLTVFQNINPGEEGSLDSDTAQKMRIARLKFSNFDLTKKMKDIVDAVTLTNIKKIVSTPFLYSVVESADKVTWRLGRYFGGVLENIGTGLSDYIGRRGELLSQGSGDSVFTQSTTKSKLDDALTDAVVLPVQDLEEAAEGQQSTLQTESAELPNVNKDNLRAVMDELRTEFDQNVDEILAGGGSSGSPPMEVGGPSDTVSPLHTQELPAAAEGAEGPAAPAAAEGPATSSGISGVFEQADPFKASALGIAAGQGFGGKRRTKKPKQKKTNKRTKGGRKTKRRSRKSRRNSKK